MVLELCQILLSHTVRLVLRYDISVAVATQTFPSTLSNDVSESGLKGDSMVRIVSAAA